MGKIKGWKKDEDADILVYESVSGNRIGTFKRTFQDWYSVYYNGRELPQKMTKSKAKSYIINYMRRHPNG